MKNWRPISLLNTVYKLASSCIAERIKSVLPILISNDQMGFIPGRYIGEHTVLINDILHFTKSRRYQEFSSSYILRKLLTLLLGCLLKVFWISLTSVSPLNNGLKLVIPILRPQLHLLLFLP